MLLVSLFRKSSPHDLCPLPTVLASVSTAGAGVCWWPLTSEWTTVSLCSPITDGAGVVAAVTLMVFSEWGWICVMCDHRSAKIISSSSCTDLASAEESTSLWPCKAWSWVLAVVFVGYYKHIPLDTDQLQTALRLLTSLEITLKSLWPLCEMFQSLYYKCCWSFYALTN